jgi:hypothetical protein
MAAGNRRQPNGIGALVGADRAGPAAAVAFPPPLRQLSSMTPLGRTASRRRQDLGNLQVCRFVGPPLPRASCGLSMG